MTILRIMNRGMSREMYESLRTRLNIDEQHPLGLIMHGVTEVDGMMQVAQVWESAWYAQRFDEDLVAPLLQQLDIPVNVEISVFELENLVTP